MEQTKVKVSKTTLDSAIKALQDLDAARVAARSVGKKLKRKEYDLMWNITYGYCRELYRQAEESGYLGVDHFWEIINICVDMSATPYETAYKMLALLGIEVAE